ncbi:molybdopterin-dependent oxidoreductase [Raoultibacter massiliensis]|uniref:Molybdopterin-dependent oxidoreductase n=1 Tax=Raoultibacter massiliensis TaxID=1852371 RepID=A0ABV1JDV4_9ACTN
MGSATGKTIVKGMGFCASAIGANVCSVDVDEDEGRILRIRPFHFDEKYDDDHFNAWKIEARGHTFEPGYKVVSGPLSYGYKKRVYSRNRIPYPMKRVDWDPRGERNPQNRGKSKYVRVSWDEAAQIIAEEIKRIHDEYGPLSILVQGDGHGETKFVHGTHGCQTRMLGLIGDYTLQARQPDSWEGWYWGAKHIWGMDPLGQQNMQNNVIKDISENGDAVLFWGADPETTPWGWGGMMASRLCFWFTEIGVMQIHISPDVNYTNAVHADKWIPVLPNTDAALQLAIAYVWLSEGTFDRDYLDTHSIGFDNFAYYVMGGEDGIPKTPKWAEKKCGVPSYTIKALARYWAKHAVSIAHCNGGSFIRSAFAHEPARLEVALLGMQSLGKPGANQFKFIEWSLFGMESVTPMPPSVEIPNCGPAFRGRQYSVRPSIIPKTMIPEAITNPPVQWYGHIAAGLPREDQFVGPLTFPLEGKERIHMIWSDAPCWETCWNGGNEMQEALRHESIEFLLIQHPWMENDCLFADILLPINTKFEEEDIGTDSDNGMWSVVYYEQQAIESLGESKSDLEAVEEVAKKLEQFGGIYEDLHARMMDGGKTVGDFIKAGFENTGAAEKLSFEEFKEKQYYPFPTKEKWEDLPVGLSQFYEDPESHPLTTPSGKLEYYSTALADIFPDDEIRGPIPRWIEEGDGHEERIDSKRAIEYPFLIVSNHPRWRVHANCDDITWLREIQTCKVVGPDGYAYEPVWVNPVDAGKLGLKTGDVAKIYNERGGVLGGVIVFERIIPGAIYQDHGARVDTIVSGVGGLDRGGANNLIAPSATTSKNAHGEVTSGFLVNIEKVDVFQLAEQYPEAFGRAYDPASGVVVDEYIVEGN